MASEIVNVTVSPTFGVALSTVFAIARSADAPALSETPALLLLVSGSVWSEALIVGYGELGPAEAEPRLRHAESWIADQPNSPGLALTLGRLCIQCKLWGKACEYLERGLAIEAELLCGING